MMGWGWFRLFGNDYGNDSWELMDNEGYWVVLEWLYTGWIRGKNNQTQMFNQQDMVTRGKPTDDG